MALSAKKSASRTKSEPAFTQKWGKFWRVTQRTVQRWVRRPEMPRVDDVQSMIRWSAGPERKPASFLKRVAELRIEREGGKNATANPAEKTTSPESTKEGLPVFADADWAEFERDGAPIADPREQLQTLEKFRDYYAFKLRKSNRLNDEAAIRNFSDLVIKYEKAIRDNKLAADKLGIEAGDLLPRAAHEAIISALAFWSMRSVDAALDGLCKKLLNLSFPEEARNILEPALLSVRFFDPLVHSARTSSRNALPGWFIERYVETLDDYIENGRSIALSELSSDLPPALIDGGGI